MKPYVLPDLPYDFADLEPVISAEIMELHYKKHHQTYINNFNVALEKWKIAEEKEDASAMLSLLDALRFNGGGHINHTIFWSNLLPSEKGGGGEPSGTLKKRLEEDFGSFAQFSKLMTQKAVSLQGSGWAWLVVDPELGRLKVITCNNQDPVCQTGLEPLLGFDVWEHAYYLQYKNVRADYVKNLWNIINWKNVEERLYKVVQK